MRVLGIDPGLTTTGYAVVEAGPRSLQARAFGAIRTGVEETPSHRLARLYSGVLAVIDEHRPAEVAIERLFFSVNVKTAMSVGQACGAVLAAAGARDLPVSDYTPPEVKQSVVGIGDASKLQVQLMVARVLGLSGPPEPADAADACALAICHLNRGGLDRATAAAVRGIADAAPGLAAAISAARAREEGGRSA